MNERWCVRCNSAGPTPLLRSNVKLLLGNRVSSAADLAVLDLGCGNGRNTRYIRSLGCTNTVAFDMAGDVGHPLTLGKRPLPLFKASVDVVLANYVLMFLNAKELTQTLRDIQRVARPDCRIIVELYPAKDSFAPTPDAVSKLLHEISWRLDWHVLRYRDHSESYSMIAAKP